MQPPLSAAPRTIGPYEVHGQIAAGGMGAVHLGLERATGRPVAIKRLLPELAADPEFVAMFRDEAHLAARVRHPGVVATIDVLEGAGTLFLVMEYVGGASLAAALCDGPAPPAVAARIVADALGGLHAAHEARDDAGAPLEIVHRDVSPQNVLVGEDGAARLADFGIARAAARFHATRPGQLKGKLRYMAPEQIRGATATRRSDVYSAAMVLWEALAGERLFSGESYAEIFGRVLEGIVRPPSAFARVPPALDAVVLAGLAREPGARFATAAEMAAALVAAMPPALPVAVAAWLSAAAPDEVGRGRRLVAAMLGGGPPESWARAAPARPQEDTPTVPRGLGVRPRT